MVHVVQYLPELDEPERIYIQCLVGWLSGEQMLKFATAYRLRRTDPQTVLLASIIGLVAFPGFQRFWLGDIGVGFLHLCSCGLLLIGSISDLARYRSRTLHYNQRVARQIGFELFGLRNGEIYD